MFWVNTHDHEDQTEPSPGHFNRTSSPSPIPIPRRSILLRDLLASEAIEDPRFPPAKLRSDPVRMLSGGGGGSIRSTSRMLAWSVGAVAYSVLFCLDLVCKDDNAIESRGAAAGVPGALHPRVGYRLLLHILPVIWSNPTTTLLCFLKSFQDVLYLEIQSSCSSRKQIKVW